MVNIFLLALAGSVPFVGAAVTIDLNRVQGRTGSYLKGLPSADRSRAIFLKNKGYCDSGSTVHATQLDYVEYTITIGVGSPSTEYNVGLDSGSSNTFVGTGIPYVRTNTSIPTGEQVNVTYGTGFFTGDEYLDQVTIAPGIVIANQSIGDALQSSGFEGTDGLIGVGPKSNTNDTLFPNTTELIPTVMDNALQQGLIDTEVLGIYFAPATNESDNNGAMTLGGVDSEYYLGKVMYTPVTDTFPSNLYWGINITGATYGFETIIPSSSAGIVDTGTTLVYLANEWFDSYLAAIPGSYFDANNTGLIVIPESSVDTLLPLEFEIGGVVYTLTATAQLLPKDQNTAWGGEEDLRYGYIGPIGYVSGTGMDFILGMKFLQRYYSVFDTTNNRVGFAYTANTFSLL
ncbi:Polyporopepsin [Sparassis crispa]|uniref:Polyporopepsin n=1 Tax=Sparassis crispa TaxID=139825 RepID=A0A401H4Y8_9APHY|nr:Polyporopepsin [Sparassis crispa]GBE89461.1 Polyporopepsin [Sparassis crispa]